MNIQSTSNSAATAQRNLEVTSTAPRKAPEALAKRELPEVGQPLSATKSSEEQLQEAVKQTNDFIRPLNGSLQFAIDRETGTTVVKVLDLETKEVIKQIPSEDMLNLAKALDQLKGLLVKQQA